MEESVIEVIANFTDFQMLLVYFMELILFFVSMVSVFLMVRR